MVSEVQMPTFQTPNLTAGDKAAEVFGNSNAANTKRSEADFKNQLNMTKYQYDLFKDSVKNQDSWKTEGLMKAGINPMIAYSQNAGIGTQNYSSYSSAQGQQAKKVKQQDMKDLLNLIMDIGGKGIKNTMGLLAMLA